ncbi:MAG: hypothetical protein ACOYD9_05705 [Pyramidobacter sp.]|jgi:hypothetical protein
MIKLIQAACRWGRGRFDGWVIGKARYCLRSRSEAVSYESMPKKVAPRYVLLETAAYDADGLPCRSLEICLVNIKGDGKVGSIKESPRTSGQLTMTFLPEDLKSFLAASGDTNPIHSGANAVVPGLWIFSRLVDVYGAHSPPETFSIRFLHPVRAGDSVCLRQKDNGVMGTVGSATCFAMTIDTTNRTSKRRLS